MKEVDKMLHNNVASPEALVQRGKNAEIIARAFSHKLIKLSPAQIEDVIAYSDQLLKNQYTPLL